MIQDKEQNTNGGTGGRLGTIAITLAGVAALSATVVSFVSVWLQAKNYRKPLLQRYVIRILLIIPFFSAASWASLVSHKVASWIDPFRDVYEAFTIYAFFQLLINFIGGERALIILMHGRAPVSHLWPLGHFLPKVDISDPHTFLAIKRGILQYTWIKPLLAIAAIIMKATDTYQGGFISVGSGYFWSGLIYNISITVCLYALALFWVCMSADLEPFRPVPKFLCIKGIIFASYWQGFFLSILVWLRAIPDNVSGYTRDNLAAAVQDALICFEMPIFAVLHWYAFSWHDYADVSISAARMPVKFALRDACGPVDLIQDAKETFAGSQYKYRYFDSGDDVLAHEESRQRWARLQQGMRYERGGKGKYWIPKPGEAVDGDSRTPLLGNQDSRERTSSSASRERDSSTNRYGTNQSGQNGEPILDTEEEDIYNKARALEFGDWNYPVITAHHASHEDRLYSQPVIVSNSTNRHILQPTGANRRRRKSHIDKIQKSTEKGKHRENNDSSSNTSHKKSNKDDNKQPASASSASDEIPNGQLVDLVVEDEEADEIERVRARKEGSAEWNKHEPKHYVRAYPKGDYEEVVREGHEPTVEHNRNPDQLHLDRSFTIGEEEVEDNALSGSKLEQDTTHWTHRDYNEEGEGSSNQTFAAYGDEPNVWSSPSR